MSEACPKEIPFGRQAMLGGRSDKWGDEMRYSYMFLLPVFFLFWHPFHIFFIFPLDVRFRFGFLISVCAFVLEPICLRLRLLHVTYMPCVLFLGTASVFVAVISSTSVHATSPASISVHTPTGASMAGCGGEGGGAGQYLCD